MEKVSKRVNAIQEVKESVSLLSQLLEGYSKESCSQSNQELIKVITAQHIKTSFSYTYKLLLDTLIRGVFMYVSIYRIFTSAVKR